MRKEEKTEEGFVAPARLREEHIVLNPQAPERLRRYAVKDGHPLVRAFEKGQLDCGRRDHTARDRFEAGLIYRGLYETVYGSGMAVSKLVRVNGATHEARAAEPLVDARRRLGRIMASMPKDHELVLRKVIGEGYTPAEAVNARFKGFEKHVRQFFCACLDNLVDAVVRQGLHRLRHDD